MVVVATSTSSPTPTTFLAKPYVEILKPKFQPRHKYVHNNKNNNYYNQYSNNNNIKHRNNNNKRILLRNHPPAVVSFTTSYFEVFVNGVRIPIYNLCFVFIGL